MHLTDKIVRDHCQAISVNSHYQQLGRRRQRQYQAFVGTPSTLIYYGHATALLLLEKPSDIFETGVNYH